MVKVKILKAVASPTFSYAAGDEVKLTKKQAAAFIEAEIAAPLETEKATAPKAARKAVSKGEKG